jgi:uncharacterized protein YcaQ
MPTQPQRISGQQARNLALGAQGFQRKFSSLDEVLQTTHVFQLDSVNVFERAHLLPAFSRMGAYPLAEFEQWAFGQPQIAEEWAHCAALVSKTDWALFDFRRQESLSRPSVQTMLKEQAKTIAWIRSELQSNGPMTVSQFEHDQNKRRGNWWGWSEVKLLLERLYDCGELVSAGRTKFSRLYALPEQVALPKPTLSKDAQKLALITKSVAAVGVGTAEDIADYFRFRTTDVMPLLKQLVEEGVAVEVEVGGWEKSGYALAGLDLEQSFNIGERQVRLLSPFDPITWRRDRAQRLYEFDYRIEIYTPEAKRKYGYYTLPILYRDRLVGRVDLKNDRKARALNVLSLWHEPWLNKNDIKAITTELVKELKLAANWVGAETLNPPSKGNWALGRV